MKKLESQMKNLPMREKYWSELKDKEKIERMRQQVKSLQTQLSNVGRDIEPLKNIMQGDTVQVIGNVREWNGEIYVIPEVVKKVDVRWLLVRKLEIQNARKDMPADEQATGNSSLKDSIMEKIKTAEAEGGIDADTIIMDTEASPDAINTEIKKLLEEGLIYEPRPGRLRYLG